MKRLVLICLSLLIGTTEVALGAKPMPAGWQVAPITRPQAVVWQAGALVSDGSKVITQVIETDKKNYTSIVVIPKGATKGEVVAVIPNTPSHRDILIAPQDKIYK